MARNEAAFNASSIQQWCNQQFKGRAADIRSCYAREGQRVLDLGGKLPPRSVVYLSALSARAPGRASAAISTNSSALPMPVNPVIPMLSARADVAMGVPALERAEPQTSMSLPISLTGAATAALSALGANSASPPINGMVQAAPISTGAALLNTGVSLISQWLNPMTPMGMAAAPMMGRAMGGAMLTGAMSEMGGAVMGRAMSALSGLFAPGMRRPNARRVRSLVRLVGVEAAAMNLGLTVGQTAWLATRPGRRRGISARDVRTTRRVVRFACNLSSSLASVRATPRRRKC